MDKQAAFDKSFKGVIEQGGLSISEDGVYCLYRDDKGCKCGVGHLLPENTPEEAWLFKGGSSVLLNKFPELAVALEATSLEDYNFLQDLQSAHDQSRRFSDRRVEWNKADYIKRMNWIAQEHNLNNGVIDNA